MDTTAWGANIPYQPWTHPDLRLLGYRAHLDFKTESSIAFRLVGWWYGWRGWVEVHHPCAGSVRVQVRAGLPVRDITSRRCLEMLPVLFQVLGIPEDEGYEAQFYLWSKDRSIHGGYCLEAHRNPPDKIVWI